MPPSYQDSSGTGYTQTTWESWTSDSYTHDSTVDDQWKQWVHAQGYVTNSEWDGYNSEEIRVPKVSTSVWVTWTSDGTNITLPELNYSIEIWQRWTVRDGYGNYHYAYRKKEEPKPVELSPEEVERREAERIRLEEVARREREKAAKKAKEAEEARKLAEAKSLQLLLENLEANQKEIFERTGAIPVVSQSGRRYSIRKGRSGNVDELAYFSSIEDPTKREKVKSRLCFHPHDYDIPDYDVMLAQKLMLEVCEEEARKIANITEVRS